MAEDLLAQGTVVLGAAVVVSTLLLRLGTSTIAGYLVVGAVIGPAGLGWLSESGALEQLSEVGVSFLLFTIGLEVSLPELRAHRRLVFGLGAAQVGATAALAATAASLLGVAPVTAVLLGAVVAMSSTALVAKGLADQQELDTPHGVASIAVLLFQDAFAVLLLALLPLLASPEPSVDASRIGFLVVRTGLVFAAVLAAAHWLVRPFLRWVGSTRSLELSLLAALFVALAAATVAHAAGMSPALGAFMAGTALADSEYRHQLEADIRPFREVLLGLFFLTTGALLDPGTLVTEGGPVLAAVVAVTAGKALLVTGLGLLFGLALLPSLRAALVLAHVGEFGLVLLGAGIRRGAVPEDVGQVLLSSAVLGFLLGAWMTRGNHRAALALLRLLPARVRRQALETGAPVEADLRHLEVGSRRLSGHVVIGGFGRTGQGVARVLSDEGVPWLALDLDAPRVADAHRGGEPVYFGDASVPGVLRAAGVERARALVVSFENAADALDAIRAAKSLSPKLVVVARLRDEEDLDAYLEAGADVALPVELEASLGLAAQLLLALGVEDARVRSRVEEIRCKRYAELRSYWPGETDWAQSPDDRRPVHLHSVAIAEEAPCIGRRPAELGLGACGARVVDALDRHGARFDPEARPLEAGDTLVLEGEDEAVEAARLRLLGD